MPAKVHREWVARTYVADRFSAAYCFWVLCFAFAVLAPFFLAIASHSFWIKESTYGEQPDVRFQYKMVLLAEGYDTSVSPSGAPLQLFWSTNTSFNELYQDSLRVAADRAPASVGAIDTTTERQSSLELRSTSRRASSSSSSS